MEKLVNVQHNDKEVSLLVIAPNASVSREAEKIYHKTLVNGMRDNMPVMAEIDEFLEKRFPLEEERREREVVINEINDKQTALLSGRLGDQKLTREEGRKIAIEIMGLRDRLMLQNQARTALYSVTAERAADLARTNYLLYLCILNNSTRKPYFVSYEDYEEHKDSNLVLEAVKAFRDLTTVAYDEQDDPEVKWLKKYKFMNEDGRFIDNKGRLVDADYRLIDKDGRYINEAGEFVNKFGQRVDEKGQLLIVEDESAYSE